MNLTQQIERLLEEARCLLQDPDPESSTPALLEELTRVEDQIQRLMADWEDVPESLSEPIESLDAQFYAAGELYLQCCELIGQGAEELSPELLEQAQTTLQKAGRQLQKADERAHEQFKKWTDSGPSGRPTSR